MSSSRYHFDQEHPGLNNLKSKIENVRQEVLTHDLYTSVNDLDSATTFMEHHVFAVWDFMSLLKNLQTRLTCVQVPWTPEGPPASRRLINDIVLVEESDEFGDGYLSHFELYLLGMDQVGANSTPIREFIELLRGGAGIARAVEITEIPAGSAEFMKTTWEILDNAEVHAQAAAFAFGREDLIPEMFERVIRIDDHGGKLALFKDYLARHIEVDADEHTPMAMQMLIDLCGDDDAKWDACVAVVGAALTARVALWDAIHTAITTSRPEPTVA